MDREAVIRRLGEMRDDLQGAGVVHLAVFGSCARDDMRADSDIDLLVDFADPANLSLLDVVRLENDLADTLGRPVQIARPPIRSETVRRRVDSDRIDVF